ncbi:MAG: hypothetical protein Kow0074_16250 [Candidatus Zixiibacteriota bacterium]
MLRAAKCFALGCIVFLMWCLPGIAANRVLIGSDGNLRDCGVVTVGVSIENDVPLSRLSVPLIVRAQPFNQDYPLENLTMSDPVGRLAGSMHGQRTLAWDNYGSGLPNRFALFFESTSPGSDCLPAGALEEMVQITLKLHPFADLFSEFLIDTAFLSPGYAVEMLDCNAQPVTIDAFVAGNVTYIENAPPLATAEDDPVIGLAGSLIDNQIAVTEPSGNPTYVALYSGPGTINPAGLWTWQTSRSDFGTHTVTIEYGWDLPGCGPGSEFFFVEFDVEVLPADPGDLDCDGFADAADLNALIDHLFFSIPLTPCP